MKNILGIATLCLLSATVAEASVVYQDSFDDDGLSVNTNGIGGGVVNNSINGKSWSDDGTLKFSTSGTNYKQRALAYSENSFQSTGGFELTVNYSHLTSYGGASYMSFGLLSDETDLSAYSAYNPFVDDDGASGTVPNDSNTYGFGVTDVTGVFSATDGSTSTNLSSMGQVDLGTHTVVMTVENDGEGGAIWSWSLDGATVSSGTLEEFDFSKSYQFVAYGQDDQGSKMINSVSLNAIPEPATIGMLGFGAFALMALRRRIS